jgi:hypothetical protein
MHRTRWKIFRDCLMMSSGDGMSITKKQNDEADVDGNLNFHRYCDNHHRSQHFIT